MKKHNKLHEMAEKFRREAGIECQEFNDDAEEEAVREFESGKVANDFRVHADYVIGLIVERLEAVRNGQKVYPLRPYDAETLARLLSSATEAFYDAMEYDEDLSDEATVEAGQRGRLTSTGNSTSAATPATWKQGDLCAALLEYATVAAARAKQIGSQSVLDWAAIIDIAEQCNRWMFRQFRADQALRVIELEKSAATRLRLDMIISELPSVKALTRKKAKK